MVLVWQALNGDRVWLSVFQGRPCQLFFERERSIPIESFNGMEGTFHTADSKDIVNDSQARRTDAFVAHSVAV